MSADTPHVDVLAGITPALEPAFRLDQLVALSPERALYKAWDRRLKRAVALRLHLVPGSPGRDWFLRETETLAALDHPAIRHVYALGEVDPFAYRTANWIDGESLAEAIRRGTRPIPAAMSVVRDLLGALEHAHAHGIIMRRIAPTTLMLDLAGRAIITVQAPHSARPRSAAAPPGSHRPTCTRSARSSTSPSPDRSRPSTRRRSFRRSACAERFRRRWSA